MEELEVWCSTVALLVGRVVELGVERWDLYLSSIAETVGMNWGRRLWCLFLRWIGFARSPFLFWRSYFLTWCCYSDLDRGVTVFERCNSRFHRSLGHDGGVWIRKNTFIVAVGVKRACGGGIRGREGSIGEVSSFVWGDGVVIKEGDIVLAGGVRVEIVILAVVSEKESIIGFGREVVKRKVDAGTFFEKEALVF